MKNLRTTTISIILSLFLFVTLSSFNTSSPLCPSITLNNPPTNILVCTGQSCQPINNYKSCKTTFTLNSNVCQTTYTWTFTNTNTGCVRVYTSSGATYLTLTVSKFPGSAGDAITLVINDGPLTSPTYNLTGQACASCTGD